MAHMIDELLYRLTGKRNDSELIGEPIILNEEKTRSESKIAHVRFFGPYRVELWLENHESISIAIPTNGDEVVEYWNEDGELKVGAILFGTAKRTLRLSDGKVPRDITK
jgi:hypothetical protein